MEDYGLHTTLSVAYDDAIPRVKAALAEQGFGILTEIDVKQTMKQKLGVDTRRYVILGACNPPLAHQAMEAEPGIGLLLPCNVIVYEADQPDQTVVSIIDPMIMMQMTENPALPPIASDARSRMERVLTALG